jgi:hypothetical protein
MILKEMSAALEDASEIALADMQEATDYFYAGGVPKLYKRTGALGETPTVTDVRRAGSDAVAFDAYLNEQSSYLSGARPTMGDVLLLADQGVPFTTPSGASARPTVGNKGFWKKAKDEMKKSLRKTMKVHFK